MDKKLSHITILQTDKESDRLVIEKLQQHFNTLRIVTSLKEVCKHLVDSTPKVILITGDSLAATLSSYYRCYDAVKDYKVCDHRVVSLIPRQCETEAYQAFRSGIIDDYMVARPVYELHRIILICEHLLIELGIAPESDSKNHSFKQQLSKYSNDLQATLTSTIQRKESLRHAFEQSIIKINQSLDEAANRIMHDQRVELDLPLLKATLASIKSDEIRPELLQLQEKAVSLLSAFVEQKTPKQEKPAIPDQTKQVDDDDNIATQSTKAEAPPVQFNRLFNQDVDPDELLKQKPTDVSILLVEDDHISLQLTLRLLNAYRVNVEAANNGRSAFAALTAKKFDLVLMDVNLPDTNGIYIVDQVSNGPGPNSDTPIVMLSGNKNKATVSKAIERGAQGYIIKPLYKDTIIKLFKKYELPLKAKASD